MADKNPTGAEGGEDLVSEEAMIKKLLESGKYDILPKISTPIGNKGAKPKTFPPVGRGRAKMSLTANKSQINHDDHMVGLSMSGHSQIISTEVIPKIPPFSGDEQPQKGDVSYSEWRFELRCLQNDPEVSESRLLQAIRRSLRGTARKMLIPLGEKATINEILNKLDALFSDISTNGMIMQEFFNSFQHPNENVTSFGCRIESLLQTAIDNNHLRKEAKNDLLRHKFWTSLHCEKLKSQTRHKYDTVDSYDQLLREIRQVEKEISISSSSSKNLREGKATGSSVPKEKKVYNHGMTADGEMQQGWCTIEEKLDAKVSEMERRIESKLDEKLNLIIKKLDANSGRYSNSGGNKGFRGNNKQSGYGRGRPRSKDRSENSQGGNQHPKE
jgi:hypothetical protein